MRKALSWMLTVVLLFGVLALAAPVAFAEEEFEDEFEEDFEDPFADFDKWDGVTYDTSPFAGIDADNLGNNCTKPGGGAVVIDTAAKLAGLAKAVNDAAIGNGSYGAYKNLPIYITKNGEGDIVVMSIEAFERREELFKLKAKLAAAEKLRMAGHMGISLDESRARLEKIYG